MKKSILSIWLSVALLLCGISGAIVLPTASAATSGDYEYTVLSDGTAKITDYTGSAAALSIPSSIDGYTVTAIGYCAFYDCDSLTSISIPDSVTTIGYDAFYNTAYYNNSDNWEDNVLYIGNHLVGASSTLEGHYTIKAGTKTIADWTFSDCTDLTSVTIPDSVTTIGGYAFYGCTGLTSITIGNSVTAIGEGAFSYCDSLTSITVDKANTAYGDVEGVLFNKAQTTLVCYPAGKTATSYTIPNSVTAIGYEAFSDCTGLTSVTIGNSVTTIGDGAFTDCTGLTSVTIPDSVTTIGDNVFSWCTGLTSITIPDSVTAIGRYAFSYCSGLTSISIPDSVTTIGDWAFYYCDSLKDITIPNSVTTIGVQAFEYCDRLISITIPDSVTDIGNWAFHDCDSLTSVTIGNSVITIGDGAFENCDSLTSITIGNSVTTIGNSAFSYCNSFTDVYYGGDEGQWRAISIGYLNDYLTNATIHYNTLEPHWEVSGVVTEPTCTQSGEYVYTCPCGYTENRMVPTTGHTVEGNICMNCNKALESSHNYENNCDETWVIHQPNADYIIVTFSAETETERGWDYITLYDVNDNSIGRYSGTELASQQIKVDGDTVKIRLTSDGSSTYYGFAVADVYAHVVLADNDVEITGDVGSGKELAVSVVLQDETGVCYDITLIKDGEPVQPSGEVTVKLPVPTGLDATSCKVYHVADDGTKTDMNATVEDGYLVFTTDHFSLYRIEGEKQTVRLGDIDGDGTINLADATRLFYYVNGMAILTDEQLAAADYNSDGTVNLTDASRLFYYVNGML